MADNDATKREREEIVGGEYKYGFNTKTKSIFDNG